MAVADLGSLEGRNRKLGGLLLGVIVALVLVAIITVITLN
jgi:hypothetical protein